MKTVVVTGVSRGIGEALAIKFLEEGYKVIGTSTSGRAKQNSSNFEVVELDLSSSTSIGKASDEIKRYAENIDVLINNAGLSVDEELGTMDISALREDLEVNLIGLIDFTEQLIANISAGGQIVNISSVMGALTEKLEGGELDYPSYRISKTAVNMYTKTLASRLIKQGVTVSSVHPGWVKTDMGGERATRDPQEAANEIYRLVTTPHETGLFWYDGEIIPW